MKTMVYYYSRKGSNRFLAHKIAKDLNCGIEEIKPRINHLVFMLMGVNIGNRPLKSNPDNYETVILCGPIWMGKLVVPLKNFVGKHKEKIRRLIFATCCGSSFEGKDEKFGHNRVFQALKKIAGEKCWHCEAFPIGLVLTDEQKKDPDADMKYQFNEENFKGEVVLLYDNFISKIKSLSER